MVVSFWLPRLVAQTDRPPRSVLGEPTDGVAYVTRRPRLRQLIAISYVLGMVGFPYIAFMPAMAESIVDVGASGFGLMSSVSAVGALVVMIAVARTSQPEQVWRIQSICAALFSVGLVLFGIAPTFALSLATLLVFGGASSAFQAMNSTLVLTESDLEYHGRIQTLLMLGFSGFGLTALPLGALADQVGLARRARRHRRRLHRRCTPVLRGPPSHAARAATDRPLTRDARPRPSRQER
jgi:hypothetical protein